MNAHPNRPTDTATTREDPPLHRPDSAEETTGPDRRITSPTPADVKAKAEDDDEDEPPSADVQSP